MNKIKNIRQAFRTLKRMYPDRYISAETHMRTGSPKDKTVYQLYVSGYGVFGEGPTWDEAFKELDKRMAEASR